MALGALSIILISLSQILLGTVVLVQIWLSLKTRGLAMALLDDLNAIKDKLTKAKSEIVGKINELEASLLVAGTESPEVTDAVAALKDLAQGLDDVVPDVPVIPAAPVAADPEAAPVKAGDVPAGTPVVEVPASDGPAEIPADGVAISSDAIHPEAWVTPVVEAPVAESTPVEGDTPAE